MAFKKVIGITDEKQEVSYYIVEEIEKLGFADCIFTARSGGVSTGGYSSLNLALSTDDANDNIIMNRQIIAAQLGIAPQSLIYAQQTHSDNIYVVTQTDIGRGALEYSDGIADVDAFITDQPQLAMGLSFADCVPVFALDPIKKAVAIIHSGWKGTAIRIVEKTIAAMQRQYGSQASDIIIAIGPSIRSCCYTVGSDVRDEFIANYGDAADNFFVQVGADELWNLSMQAAISFQALNAGVKQHSIIDSAMCTCCMQDDFFSHRRDNGISGRMNAIARLK